MATSSTHLPLFINIDSRDRQISDDANNSFSWVAPENYHANFVRVKSVRIPRSFYDVRTGVNDAIDFNEGGGELNGTLAAGIYDATSFAAAVKTALDAAGAATYTVAVSDDTGLMTITPNAGTFGLLWTTGTNTATNASLMMGWRVSGGTQAADVAAAASVTSIYPVELNPDKEIFLRIAPLRRMMVQNNNFQQYSTSIPVNVGGYQDIFYEPASDETFPLNDKVISSLDISLRRRDGTVLDLNGRHWSLNLWLM